jgi:hypothetical protein
MATRILEIGNLLFIVLFKIFLIDKLAFKILTTGGKTVLY